MLGDAIPVPADDLAALWEVVANFDDDDEGSIIELSHNRPAILAAIDRAIAAEGEVERLRELLQGLILDPTLPEHLQVNAHKVLAAVMKVAKERDAAREQAEAIIADLTARAERQEHFATPGLYPQFTDADRAMYAHCAKQFRDVLAAYRAGRDAGEGASVAAVHHVSAPDHERPPGAQRP